MANLKTIKGMKFPTKNVKLKTISPGSSNNILRKEFLDDLPPKTRNTVRGVDLTLINEAISLILEGTVTINGKAPKTRVERYIIIGSYFKKAKTLNNMFFDGPVDIKDKYTVAFNYKEEPVVIKFPEVTAEN
jgi:hypothetical protein